jgi:CBS domain-containing protein
VGDEVGLTQHDEQEVVPMRISDIVRHKGSAVYTMAPSDTVGALVKALAEHNIGAIVVVDGDSVAGIVSERDVVRRLAEKGESLLSATVREIMTADVLTCGLQDDIDKVAEIMTERRIRHMPIVSADGLAGIISIGDVVSSRMRQLEQDRGQLEHYITG